MSGPAQEIALAEWLAAGLRCIGQISIEARTDGTFALAHREMRRETIFCSRAAPTTRPSSRDLTMRESIGRSRQRRICGMGGGSCCRIEARYASRSIFFIRDGSRRFLSWKTGGLVTTPLRETLERQTGMYRPAAKISDAEANTLVGKFCRSDGGCLRTILWKRDREGTLASTLLPAEKFDPSHDQTGTDRPVIPLLCQEACNLLVAEARKIVKAEDGTAVPP